MFLTTEKIERRIAQLDGLRYRRANAVRIAELDFLRDPDASVASLPPPDGRWARLPVGTAWQPDGTDCWLRTTVTIPEEWREGKAVGIVRFSRTGEGFSAGVEALLMVDGAPYQGLDPNHDEIFFRTEHIGRPVELLLKVWGATYGWPPDSTVPVEFRIDRAEIVSLDEAADDLYFTALAAHGCLSVLHETSWERQQLLTALDRAFLQIDWSVPGDDRFYESVARARHTLDAEIAALPRNHSVSVECIGHSHIDVAWLWRLSDTREKSARTFSTVLRLMERFPEYVFLQTQPQLYDYLEHDYPQIAKDVAERIAAGQWEAGGAMWLESDCNVPSGESLVRQLFYGIRYFERKFDTECRYLWLPDVFGYSWALPQILRKSGIEFFMTTKISWNVYNRFPHDTFVWRGIDGSEVITHYITTPEPGNRSDDAFKKFYTYNGQVLPETVTGIWSNYQDKEINDRLLLSYGWGDGGGGPTRMMLEMRRRLEKMPGIPKVSTGRVDDFFRELGERVRATDRYVHRWDGELYLELHRGTYTSQAFNKRANRQMEDLLRTAEMVSTFAWTLDGAGYPHETFVESWKIVLRNQFHDILPGSSITEVYEDCRIEYARARELAESALRGSMERLIPVVPVRREASWIVFNTLSWERDECIELPWQPDFENARWNDARGTTLVADRVERDGGDIALVHVPGIPAHGYTTVSCGSPAPGSAGTQAPGPGPGPFTITERTATTPFYDIEWDDTGALTRLYDRRLDREAIAAGEVANRFDVHEDKPAAHETWEIDIFYKEKVRRVDDLQSVVLVENGAHRAVVRFRWNYQRSTIEQDMILSAYHPRVDFATRVNWQERQQLLKVAFPVDVRATEATYEIQFGTVKRPTHWNTSWDYARFETCAHRWIDLAERGFGVSLLNDCKYGHDVFDNVMRITLIKSGIIPDPHADLGTHEFTYAFLSHAGDWAQAGTVNLAHRLNAPLVVRPLAPGTAAGDGPGAATLPASTSFVNCRSDHVIIDTVKKAEDSQEWIIRCYEYTGRRGRARFETCHAIGEVNEVNLLEREARPVAHDEHGFESDFAPYELRTFRIRGKK